MRRSPAPGPQLPAAVRSSFAVVLALGLAGLLGLAGCSSNDDAADKPSSTTTTVVTSPGTACSLLTVADATALFGRPAQPKTDAQDPSVASQCIYEATELNGQLVQFRIFDDPSYYSKNLVADGQPIKGLGAKAYVNPNGPGGIVDLQFVRGGKVYALAYSNATGDAATKAAQIEGLARILDHRL